ncbi:unnamed protein product [Arctogadus glacialis]
MRLQIIMLLPSQRPLQKDRRGPSTPSLQQSQTRGGLPRSFGATRMFRSVRPIFGVDELPCSNDATASLVFVRAYYARGGGDDGIFGINAHIDARLITALFMEDGY